jgi:hypothetical protein
VKRPIPGRSYTPSFIQSIWNASSLWVKDKFHTFLRSILGLKFIGFTPTLLMWNVVMQMGKLYTRVITSFRLS